MFMNCLGGGVVYASKLFRGSEKWSLEALWVSQKTEKSHARHLKNK